MLRVLGNRIAQFSLSCYVLRQQFERYSLNATALSARLIFPPLDPIQHFLYALGTGIFVYTIVDRFAKEHFEATKQNFGLSPLWLGFTTICLVTVAGSAVGVYVPFVLTAVAVCGIYYVQNHSPKKTASTQSSLPPALTDLTADAEFHPEWQYCLNSEQFIKDVAVAIKHPTKQSVMMIGKPGTGKSALAEHLAWLIKNKKLPLGHPLENKQIVSLAHLKISSGDGLVGTVETKLDGVVEFVKQKHVICVVDEAHMLIGQNRTQGSSADTANHLKPYLARGEIRLIGATTDEDYEFIKWDGAFERRWHPHFVTEMTSDQAVEALVMKQTYFEEHYKVKIADETILTAVALASRIKTRTIMDVATDLLCTSCGNVSVDNPEGTTPQVTKDAVIQCAVRKKIFSGTVEQLTERFRKGSSAEDPPPDQDTD
jgi:ATP-dependent Clp protease ATP-binding subunit ClpA